MNKSTGGMQRIILLVLLVLVTAVLPSCRSEPVYPQGGVARQPDWWHDAVFYEVFVRSFYDSDGDGNGDLAGLQAKLNYLNDGDPQTSNDLGVTALWLMPVMDSPTYHGYDAVDYYTIEADYGTNESFENLIDADHERGMFVIIDLMLNHTSSEHPWFVDARSGPDATYRDWYVWQVKDPGGRSPWGSTLWHEADGTYYYGIFWEGMPDLNFNNPEVTEAMHDVARFWLEEMGADGFRLDAVRHLIEVDEAVSDTEATHDWLRGFDQFTDEIGPQVLTVGEIWAETPAVVPYVDNDGVNLAFEFFLADAILASIKDRSPGRLRGQLSTVLQSYPPGQFATFLTNHDQNRVMNELRGDRIQARLAATTLLTLPGVPFIYYGEEIGMRGNKPDELIRTPMQWSSSPHAGFSNGTPWEAVNDDFGLVNVSQQTADSDSLLSHYRQLIQLRGAHPALRRGGLTTLKTTCEPVFAFLRHFPGTNDESEESILVVLNYAAREQHDCQLSLPASELAPGTYQVHDLLVGLPVSEVQVGTNGRIEPISLIPTLAPQEGYVLLLAP